jgi:hypothetical protein
MPVSCEIRGSILVVTLVGDYSFEEPVQAVMSAIADPDFHAGTSLLIDSRLSKTSRNSEDFRERARWMGTLRDHGLSSRFAIVISPKPHQFGMARMAATHLDLKGLELEIFTDMDEALRWLSKAGHIASGSEKSSAFDAGQARYPVSRPEYRP